MLSTRTIMGPRSRSHVTASVIITCAYSLSCLLPYQSVDYVVLTFNRAYRGQLSTVEDSCEGKDESWWGRVMELKGDGFHVCPPTHTRLVRASLSKTLSANLSVYTSPALYIFFAGSLLVSHLSLSSCVSASAGTFCALAHEYHPSRQGEIAGACHSSTLSSP